MTRAPILRRAIALTGALVLTSWGAVALPATAENGSGQSGQHAQGQATAPGQNKDKGKDRSGDKSGGKSGDKSGNQAKDKGNGGGNKGGSGDPAGNNGTVKIAPLGEIDGIPNNSPHPGCTFQVEWYGFDEGAEIVSTVSFAMQAPTGDVGLGVAGLTSVPVGGDPASGAGTDTGLDGTEAYTLSFDGEPHPKQGYHVKLTIATPQSNGNDTKSKVFWVAPCESETAPTEDETTDEGATDEGATEGDNSGDEASSTETEAAAAADDTLVLGAQASSSDDTEVAAAEATADGAQVPTVIDAGQSAIAWASSPMGLLSIALGGLLTALALVARRRASVRAGE